MPANLIGRTLDDRYEIKELLGEGGRALVFAAYDHTLRREVAVKIVKPEYALSSESTDTFYKEMRIIASLKHRHILSVYDRGVVTVGDQELAYLVMHLAKGGSLADRLRERILSPDEVEVVLMQICEALDYAHSRGVIHLDVKPHNILFDQNGKVLVADFGLAKLLRGDAHVKADTGFGTPPYMPPEQFAGNMAGAFSDVYALGMTLHQMLAGKPPEREWVPGGPLVNLDQSLDPNIRSVIARATQPDPTQRYRSAGKLAQAFIRTLHPLALPSPPLSPPWRLRLLGVGFASAFLVAVIVVIVLQLKKTGEEMPSGATLAASGLSPTALPSATITPISTATFTLTPTLSPSPTTTLSPTPSPTLSTTPTATPTATSAATPTPTPLPTPCVVVGADRLIVYEGPGETYDTLGEIHRGDRLSLTGRSEDGAWWRVDYLGRAGWIHAQPVGASVVPLTLPVVETPSPPPVEVSNASEGTLPDQPEPNMRLVLQNPGFEGITNNSIPSWNWWAVDNYSSSDNYDSDTSFDTPLFKQADDPARFIHWPTLQIDATGYLKFKVHVFQTVSVTPAVTVRFRALGRAYTDIGDIKLAAGIDPAGGRDCHHASWSEPLLVNQSDGIVQLTSPDVMVSREGRVTVCLYAEPLYAAANNAAFFDDVELIANPQ